MFSSQSRPAFFAKPASFLRKGFEPQKKSHTYLVTQVVCHSKKKDARPCSSKTCLQLKNKFLKKKRHVRGSRIEHDGDVLVGAVKLLVAVGVDDHTQPYKTGIGGNTRGRDKTYILQDSLDKRIHFPSQLSDFAPLRNGFYSFRAQTD